MDGERPTDATEWRQLEGYLQAVLLWIKRYVGRYGNRMIQADGRLSDLYVSLREAFELWADGAHFPPRERRPAIEGWPAVVDSERELTAHLLEMDRQLAGATGGEPSGDLPIEELRAACRLSEAEVRLLLAAAAPAISVDIGRLYSFAWADFAQKRASVGFLAELVGDTPDAIQALAACFREEGALVRHGLVTLETSPAFGDNTPLLHRSVVVPDRVIAWLQGASGPLPTYLELDAASDAPVGEDDLPETSRELIRLGLRRALKDRRGRPHLILTGQPMSGRRTLLRWALIGSGYGLLTLKLEALPLDPKSLEAALVDACREARLRRALLLIRMEALAGESGERAAGQEFVLKRVFARHDGPLAVSVSQPLALLGRVIDEPFEVPIPAPSTPRQRALWARALAESGCTTDDDLPDRLVSRFDLAAGTIFEAVAEARRRALMVARTRAAVRIDLDDVVSAVRRRVDHTLGQFADAFSTTLTWKDVVLPDEVNSQLREVLAQARHRTHVLDDWGFRRLLSYGRGLSCLFSGPPGTGKTMMAAVVAAELGREIYRVDLSRVSSKWVGETEKNLARVFDEAERGQVILLFDEADSLFSSRTEVKTSNDRFANMEINYLLQRMEAYDGITMLTTNFEKGLDEAFKRRIRFRIRFPLPDETLRARLWRSVLPAAAPVASDIDFSDLGRRFEMSGGNIKNAALRAAFRAADGSRVIAMADLVSAGAEEASEMGILVHAARREV